MVHRRPTPWLILVAGLLACGDSRTPAPPDDNPGLESAALNLRFKGSQRLGNELARALSLDSAELCQELGLYSCLQQVHRVALGGVSPYDFGIYSPAPNISVSAPLAAERIILSACMVRVDRDLATGAQPVIFRDLTIDAQGRLVDGQKEATARAIDQLYKRAVTRPASASEIASLQGFYDRVESADSDNPARQWAVLSCFAVMSSIEQLFY